MKSLSYVCSGLFCKPILCFVLSCGILVASMSSVDSIPFLSGVLILLCEYQSFLIIEIVMPILFQPTCSFSSGSDHFNIRKIISQFPNVVRFIRPQVAFVFPPTLFLQGLGFLNQVSFFIDAKSLHYFLSMFLSGDFP